MTPDYTRRARACRLVLLALLALGAQAEQVTITLLATTDLHGNIYPVDYFTGQPAARGLAKIATLVREARRESPNTLLVDCGDTIQGTPLEYVHQDWVRRRSLLADPPQALDTLRPDPMMLAMNAIGYDALVLGNHDFNFGLGNLDRARADARFPWISANTVVEPGSGRRPFEPYVVKTLAGVKVAVVGLTTPAIPYWEKLENYMGYRFLPGREAIEAAIAELRAKHRPDLVILAAHAGLRPGPSDVPAENMGEDIAAKVPGIDAIVFGHTHGEVAGERIGGVLAVQPKNWGASLARLDFVLERQGGWTVREKKSRLIRVTRGTPADEEVLRLARPYHERTERHLNTPVAESAAELDGRLARIEDSPLVDAIHAVQMHYAKADVSFTALFNPRVRIPKGPVTARQIAALYIYENELCAIEGDGRMVKDALENAARYFLTCPDAACSHGPLVSRKVIGYNFDMAQGVEYEIDLTQPEGRRIRNLRWRGRPLAPAQKLRIAVNNYRAGGSAGYTMFRGAKVLWRSAQDVRGLMIDYYTDRKRLPERADGNWRIVPPAALARLEAEMAADAARPGDRY